MKDILPTPGHTEWFVRDRFGMFIHWGLYAMGARHEWLQHNESIPTDEYRRKYFDHFKPDLFDPDHWACVAKQAGMKYVVITAKHHDGFCLWDTEYTDFKAPNTKAGRDLLRPILEAFRKQEIRTGIYYSLIDWHHSDFVIDPYFGPYRNAKDRETRNQSRDQSNYAQYMRNQVRELLTAYGPVDILWCDFSYSNLGPEGKGRNDWESDALLEVIRKHQPNIILNDRLELPDGWDVKTPEQIQPRRCVTYEGRPVVWETCQTFSGSWGYYRDEESWKSMGQLVRMLINSVSRSGNLLLNVGPNARGEFDPRALERLEGMGEWMRLHNRSIYGCTQAPEDYPEPENCRYTYNPKTHRLYVHLLAWPFKYLHLSNIANKFAYAQMLHDGSEVQTHEIMGSAVERMGDDFQDVLTLQLPVKAPEVTVPVIEIFLQE